MEEEFKKYIEENNLISQSDRILLAVSGGVDSMVMAHLFLSSGVDLAIAHCNFKLRGKESEKDEEFVRQFAQSQKIPFFSEEFDTTGFASESGISIQMAARELRYNWFEEIREKNNFTSISVAHNLNDNVETFLINLSRGTGIAGLTGMKPRHNNIIRPLLFATRESIMEFSNRYKIGYREDMSNAETKYTRNKIRHEIIPHFKEINPSFEKTIAETAERFFEINEIIAAQISELRKNICEERGKTIAFKISLLKGLIPRRTLLFELFRPFGIGKEQIRDLVNLINGKTGTKLITADYTLINNRKEILVSKRKVDNNDRSFIQGVSDFPNHPGNLFAEIITVGKDFKIPESSNIACLDADKVVFPVAVRNWKQGDSFFPLGMKKKKKLSDYFVDKKYSFFEKENCRILESGSEIVWIINDRIDNRFRITSSTKRALIIKSSN